MVGARACRLARAAPRPPARWCAHQGSKAQGCRGRERVGTSSWLSVWSGGVASGVRSIRGTWHQNRCLTPKRIWSQALSMSNRRHRAWEGSDHTPLEWLKTKINESVVKTPGLSSPCTMQCCQGVLPAFGVGFTPHVQRQARPDLRLRAYPVDLLLHL